MPEETKKTSDTCNGCKYYWPLFGHMYFTVCKDRDHYESNEEEKKDAKE